MSLWSRIRNAIRPAATMRELDAEFASHLEEASEHGLDPAVFGSALRYREQSLDVKLLPWLDSLRADIVFGFRQLARRKTSTFIAILSLALGIGAVTSTFRLIDAAFLRPLPVRAPERLHFLRYTSMNIDGKQSSRDAFSYPLFLSMRDSLRDDAELIMVSFADRQDITYGVPADVEKVSRQYISANAFSDFALQPALGRLFGPAQDQTTADHRVAVITHDYWQRRFGLDPAVIGRTFRYLDDSYVIIGVIEPKFTGTSTGAVTDIFLPLLANDQATRGDHGDWNWARILVHLKPHTTPELAEQKLRVNFTQFREEDVKRWTPGTPKVFIDAYRNAKLQMLPAIGGASNFRRDFLLPLSILAACAGLLLILCCASVANLLTAQAATRAREMALRISIGAGRGRLLQLLLVQSLMLAVASTVVGLLFAWWSSPFLVGRLNPPDNPVRIFFTTDWRVFAFIAALSFTVTLLFGVTPALQASGVHPIEALRGGSNSPSRRRVMRSLVAVQVAFCFLVCFIAALLVSSLHKLYQQPLGFSAERLLLVETGLRQPVDATELWRQLTAGAGEVHGVESVALSGWPLQTGGANITDIQVGARPVEIRGPYIFATAPGWFDVMRIPILEGRDFNREEKDPVALVNSQFARSYFNGRSPLGETFAAGKTRFRIIGMAADIRMRDVREEIRPTVFFPFNGRRDGTIALRLKPGTPEGETALEIRRMVDSRFPHFRITNIRTQLSLIQVQTIIERLLAALSSFFGVVALTLAALGVYGVLAYSVSQRSREFAVRLALGARALHLVRAVLGESALTVFLGAALGLVFGLAAESFLKSFLFETSASDPSILGAVALALLFGCLIAASTPALRAVRIDPARTLRSD